MSGREAVVAAPGFAGGSLRTYNRLVCAAARRGADGIELALDGSAAGGEIALRVLNARGDPLALPAPPLGALRDERERALWAAALNDLLPPTADGARVVNEFLPHGGESAADAGARLWRSLVPGLPVRARADDERDAPAADPELVWIGAHQRKALRELGLAPAELLRAEAGEEMRYRPELGGEAAAALEELRAATAAPLARIRGLATEVDPGLLGAVARMERSFRRGMDDFARAAERSLVNHAGIRRARWHAVAQALRPAGGPQADGISLLAAVALFGLKPARLAEYAAQLRERTSLMASADPIPLFLDC